MKKITESTIKESYEDFETYSYTIYTLIDVNSNIYCIIDYKLYKWETIAVSKNKVQLINNEIELAEMLDLNDLDVDIAKDMIESYIEYIK